MYVCLIRVAHIFDNIVNYHATRETAIILVPGTFEYVVLLDVPIPTLPGKMVRKRDFSAFTTAQLHLNKKLKRNSVPEFTFRQEDG